MDGFVPDDLLESLLNGGQVQRDGCLLTTADGRNYVLEDAVRVLGSSNRHSDPFGYVGMVASVRYLLRRGFVMSAERVALDRTVYDVEYGVIAHPLATEDQTGITVRKI